MPKERKYPGKYVRRTTYIPKFINDEFNKQNKSPFLNRVPHGDWSETVAELLKVYLTTPHLIEIIQGIKQLKYENHDTTEYTNFLFQVMQNLPDDEIELFPEELPTLGSLIKKEIERRENNGN